MKRRNLFYFLNMAGIILFILPFIIITISTIRDNSKVAKYRQDAIWLARYRSHYEIGLDKIIKLIDSDNSYKIDNKNWQIVKPETGYLFTSKMINKTIFKVKLDGSISEENTKH